MSSIVLLSGSPFATSRTVAVLDRLADYFHAQRHQVSLVWLRELPAAALLGGSGQDPAVATITNTLASADGLVVASPVYKAAYSGLLKAFLDLLPQSALASKVVLPPATGGSNAHVLAIDYAMRPVLTSMGADHIVPG